MPNPQVARAAVRTRVTRHLVVAATFMLIYATVPLPETTGRTVVAGLAFLVGLLALVLYVAHMVRREQRSLTPDHGVRIESLLLLLYAVLTFFALAYLRIAQTPGEFEGLETRIDSLYFAMATLATVGFGDVHAVGQTARLVVTVHMFFDLVFLGIAAHLVSSSIARRRLAPSSDRATEG